MNIIDNRFNQFSDFVNFCNLNRFKFIPSNIEFYKEGNKIHIKKKNRGSFTRYCGGNVTEECIRKGKASPNPAIRKKAVFAANSRKWNH